MRLAAIAEAVAMPVYTLGDGRYARAGDWRGQRVLQGRQI